MILRKYIAHIGKNKIDRKMNHLDLIMNLSKFSEYLAICVHISTNILI